MVHLPAHISAGPYLLFFFFYSFGQFVIADAVATPYGLTRGQANVFYAVTSIATTIAFAMLVFGLFRGTFHWWGAFGLAFIASLPAGMLTRKPLPADLLLFILSEIAAIGIFAYWLFQG